MKLNELEYKTINIMDEVCTVEVAFANATNTIHIFDTAQAVEPEYDFVSKQFVLSDNFTKMAEVLASKQYILTNESLINRVEWRFYASKQTIKIYKNNKMTVVELKTIQCLKDEQLIERNYYPRYVKKLISQ